MLKTKFGNAKIDSTGHYRITTKKNHGKQLHRLIFEDYYKCTILDGVDCHHINGNKTDNTIENLTLMYHGDHSRYHNTGDKNPKAREGVTLSDETKHKISKSNNGKGLKPEPHIVLGGVTSKGKPRYRLVVNSEVVASSIDKNKLLKMIEEKSYESYNRKYNYTIDLNTIKKEYENGKTMEELGKIYGCSRKTISRRLHKIYSDEEIHKKMCKNISNKLKRS